jgi:hypothetical protein
MKMYVEIFQSEDGARVDFSQTLVYVYLAIHFNYFLTKFFGTSAVLKDSAFSGFEEQLLNAFAEVLETAPWNT